MNSCYPRRFLRQDSLQLTQFFKLSQCIFAIDFVIIISVFSNGYFVSFKKNSYWPSGSGDEDENVKKLPVDLGLRTDGRWTTGDQESPRDFSAQVSQIFFFDGVIPRNSFETKSNLSPIKERKYLIEEVVSSIIALCLMKEDTSS